MYVVGYLAKENRVYLCDRDINVVSYLLSVVVLEYQTAIMRQDFDTADRLVPQIPDDQRSRVARFLEKQVCVITKWLWINVIPIMGTDLA